MKKGGTTVLSSLTKSLEAFCQGLFSVIGKFVPITLKAPRGCAPRGEEFNASHTARARKCAAGAHFILM